MGINTTMIPYLSTFLSLIGLFIYLLSKHDFFDRVSTNLRRLPKHFQDQVTAITLSQFQKNKFLAWDQTKIVKDLQDSEIRFRGKTITMSRFITLSFISSFMNAFLAYFFTTKSFKVSMEVVHYYNFPSVIIAIIMGFAFPRWILMIIVVRKKFKYHMEASNCFFILSSTMGENPNIEVAILKAMNRFPKYTGRLFKITYQDLQKGHFNSFTEMIFWLANKLDHQHWKEFAHITQTDTTAGIQNRQARMTILTNRAEEILSLQKGERKGLKFRALFTGVMFVILFGTLFFLSTFGWSNGIYLYTTPTGKLILTAVYLFTIVEAVVFTWLFYQV